VCLVGLCCLRSSCHYSTFVNARWHVKFLYKCMKCMVATYTRLILEMLCYCELTCRLVCRTVIDVTIRLSLRKHWLDSNIRRFIRPKPAINVYTSMSIWQMKFRPAMHQATKDEKRGRGHNSPVSNHCGSASQSIVQYFLRFVEKCVVQQKDCEGWRNDRQVNTSANP